MRVYIAGTRPAGIMELTARFGDSGVGAENCCAAGGADAAPAGAAGELRRHLPFTRLGG